MHQQNYVHNNNCTHVHTYNKVNVRKTFSRPIVSRSKIRFIHEYQNLSIHVNQEFTSLHTKVFSFFTCLYARTLTLYGHPMSLCTKHDVHKIKHKLMQYTVCLLRNKIVLQYVYLRIKSHS